MTVNGTGPATSWMAEKTLVADLDESVVPEPPSSLKAMSSDTEISIAWLPPRHNRIMVRGTVECSCVNIVAFCSCFPSSVTVLHKSRQLKSSIADNSTVFHSGRQQKSSRAENKQNNFFILWPHLCIRTSPKNATKHPVAK